MQNNLISEETKNSESHGWTEEDDINEILCAFNAVEKQIVSTVV